DPGVQSKITVNIQQVLDRLSASGRASVVEASSDGVDPRTLAGLARFVPPPWPTQLSDVVLESAAALGREQSPKSAFYELVRAAAVGLPPDRADDLVAVASYKDELRPAL